jgi:probable rRNA maturation factor
VDIQVNYDYRENDLREIPIEELTAFVLAYEDKPFNTEVSINFVTNETMAYLNERFRHREGPTDVLSFECDGVQDEVSTDGEEPVFELGDIVIAPDIAHSQSRDYGTTFREEISLLLVHGLLHLCGYDHIRDEDAEVMQAKESEILEAWSSQEDKKS